MSQFDRMRRLVVAGVVGLAASAADAQVQQGQRLTYPDTKKVEQSDDFYGQKVVDPYRWMEDLNSPDVADWVHRENAVTFFFQAEDGIRDTSVTGVQTCALPI